MKLFKKGRLKKILSVILAFLISFGAIVGIVKLIKFFNKDTKVIMPSYAIGSINQDGNYDKSNKFAICTKDKAFECQGLQITKKFDSEITYDVVLYDVDGEYLHTESNLNSDFTLNNFSARYARIVIYTNNSEKEVKFYNILNIARSLKISVNKVQNFTTYNYISEAVITTGKKITTTSIGTVINTANEEGKNIAKITCLNHTQFKITCINAMDNKVCLYLADSDNKLITKVDYSDITGKEYRFEFKDSNNNAITDAQYMYVVYDTGYNVSIYDI